YEASTPAEVMFKCLMEPPPRLLDTISDLSPMLETIIARAMAKDRDERFGTACELAIALQTAIQNVPQGVGVSSALIEAAVPAQPQTTPGAVKAEAVVAPEAPSPAPITVEESPAAEMPSAPPTVVATPPTPTIPVAAAPEAVEAAMPPMSEVPPTVAVPIEVVEAAPVEEPRAEAIPAEIAPEAGVLVQAGLPVDAAGATSEAAPAMVETEARPAAPELTAEIEPMTPTVITSSAQPMKQRASRPLARFVLPLVAIAVIVLLIVGGAIFGPGIFNQAAATPTEMSVAILEATSSPTRTISPSPTLTSTSSPTITSTRTPRPTATRLPIIAFAEPILAAITDQKPDFQDDFSTRGGGWTTVDEWCAGRLKYVEGEMVVSGCRVSREMWYTDFVAEMEARFLPGSPSDSGWTFQYRREAGGAGAMPYFFDFKYSGDVGVSIQEIDSTTVQTTWLQNAAQPGATVNNHVLVIVKDQNVALFVNDRPVYYGTLPPRWKNGGMEWSFGDTVAFDNLKIWDISNLPLTATPTPELPIATSTSAASPDTGAVEGRTIWNGQPFAGVIVKLCTKWLVKCQTTEYSAVSDAEGNYTITGIPPGDYDFIVKMPDRIGEDKYSDWVIKVIAGRTTTVEDAQVSKQDLLLSSPAHGATVSSTTPTLSWKAYPGATEYGVTILCTDAGGARSGEVHEHGITTTQWTVTPPLPGGVTCSWGIGASGPNGDLAGSRFYRFTAP
ncbi:MAG: hypothetical protein AAB217_21255, partial [Chloroflexota bacterium]